MKEADKRRIDLERVAGEDPRCEQLQDSLLEQKTEPDGRSRQWTRQFQASGGKTGVKNDQL